MKTLALSILLCTTGFAQTTQRVSIGTEASSNDEYCTMSADGRFVAFASSAANLVPADTNGYQDVFVRDLQSGVTERVSVSTTGGDPNSTSSSPSISSDGRFVAFFSTATNLVAGATHHGQDVFVRDRLNGTTELVSVPIGAGVSFTLETERSAISADGRYVAFRSGASDLVAGDVNGKADVFVRDRQTATTQLVSLSTGGAQSNGDSDLPSISSDGRFVAFTSAGTNLVAGDTNGATDVFVRDLQASTTQIVSVDSSGILGNAASTFPSISADGTFVTFASTASNLVAGDTNGVADVFLRDRSQNTTERVSLANNGAQGDALSGLATSPISSDGRYVAFDSNASNIVAGDSPGGTDVFVRDRQTATTLCVSLYIPGNIPFNQGSGLPVMSADGSKVAYFTDGTNIALGSLAPSNIVAWNRATGITQLVSSGVTQGNSTSDQSAISADGTCTAFRSFATNLEVYDTNSIEDIFVYDRKAASLQWVSMGFGFVPANGSSDNPALSSDGRFVAFDSQATNLLSAGNPGGRQIYRFDRMSLQMVLVSVPVGGGAGNNTSNLPAMSADARYIAFTSSATNLVPGDTNAATDIFVRDVTSGTTERVSVATDGSQANGNSNSCAISADGRYVAFTSDATNLVAGDTNGATDIFVHDRTTGTTERVNLATGGGQAHNGVSNLPSISGDGRFVAFASFAANLVPGDTNGSFDVFVRDRVNATTELISVAMGGGSANDTSDTLSISADGRFVAFGSAATNLVAGDTNAHYDIFVRDRQMGTTERVNLASDGSQANQDSFRPVICAGGRYVAFQSQATNLVSNDTNAVGDVFVRDRGVASAFTSFCPGDGSSGACPCANNGVAGHGCQNSAGTGGALLSAAGAASLASDTVVLTSANELPTALSIYLQGTSAIAPSVFGDGLRCTGGSLKRLYTKHAVGGSTSAPQSGDAAISARSSALGDTIAIGSTRDYQVYYRDANIVFCAGGYNVSTAISVAWGF